MRHVHTPDKKINIKAIRNSPFQILNDGECNFRLQTYYVKPLEQIHQLNEFCKEVHVYSLITGHELKEDQIKDVKDPWLYYLAILT